MPYTFSCKTLKCLNTRYLLEIEPRIPVIVELFKLVLENDIEVDSFLVDLTAWLANDVCQDAHKVKVCATPLLSSIQTSWKWLKGHKNIDIVACFLVEALRCYNFANHNSAAIREFIKLFKELRVTLVCDDRAVEHATFSILSYDGGVVTMIP